jgi:hypothetical protein
MIYTLISYYISAINKHFQNCIYVVHLQRIGKNEGSKKPVISSIPASGAELHVSALKLLAHLINL